MLEKLLNIADKHLVWLLTGIFVLRVAYLFGNGLDLTGDESYYWDWSRIPDWCYYSKPPMVAWLIAIITGLGGDHTAIVRLPAVLLGTVFLIYLYAATKVFYSAKAGVLAVLLVLATPFNVLANFVMTIDPPLYCFWVMSLYYLHNALFSGQQQAWCYAGLSTAAALLSKQVALLIPLSLIVFLMLDQQRAVLHKRGLINYFLLIVMVSIPLLWWNQQHQWVMFGHSKGHFGVKETVAYTVHLEQAGSFLLYQFLLLSPAIFVWAMVTGGKACFRFKHLNPKEQFLVLMGPVLLIGILALSLLQKVQGNWPMPFYISALILLSGRILAGQWQKSLKTGLAVGYLMVALTYALPLLIQAFNWHNTIIDPTYRFRHWSELAAAINTERQKALPDAGSPFMLAIGHRYLASQLAFYLPDHPKVYRYEPSGKIVSQYEVWPGPVDKLGLSAFIVSESGSVPDGLKAVFGPIRKIADVANPMAKNSFYTLYLAENLKFWPPQPIEIKDK